MKEGITQKTVLACDIGASSGRVLAIGYDGRSLTFREVRRFRNMPALVNGTLYWNILNILTEIKTGIAEGCALADVVSVGIDTWGVDFGLIGSDGQLLSGVVHYRDNRTRRYKRLYDDIRREELYTRTGTQEMALNTINQLDYLRRENPALLAMTRDVLPVPDLLNYFLTGRKQSEYTIASTTGLLDARARDWDRELIDNIGFDTGLFKDIVMPGASCGMLSAEIRSELELPEIEIINVASHDTASAAFAASAISFGGCEPTIAAANLRKTSCHPSVAGYAGAMSANGADSAIFLSCGTWCLLGVETDEPCTTEQAMACGFTNEGGAGGRILFMKNIPGTWLVQECVRKWRTRGKDYTYEELDKEASVAKRFMAVIDVNDKMFVMPDDMPKVIREHTAKYSGNVPASEGEMVRCIYEGLAFMFRRTIDEMHDCIGNSSDVIKIIGGGAKSALLCQVIADITRKQVVVGASEATALGNAAIQLRALGEFANDSEAKLAIAAGNVDIHYEPRISDDEANDYYSKYLEATER